jgi:hypothetical protein
MALYFLLMKLPRGTFHSIKKDILLRLLLDDMEKTKFTGFCTISCGIETCTLVLNSGIYILADYAKSEGDAAWQKMQKMLDMKVDAGLTTLNPAQLQLTREFNPHATLPSFVRKSTTRQVRTGITNSGIMRTEDIPGSRVRESRLENRKDQGPHPEPGIKPAEEQASASGISPTPVEQQSSGSGPEENGTNIDRDLEALDKMDIDEMTKKIRENFKVTIENLDLDHLIENEKD